MKQFFGLYFGLTLILFSFDMQAIEKKPADKKAAVVAKPVTALAEPASKPAEQAFILPVAEDDLHAEAPQIKKRRKYDCSTCQRPNIECFTSCYTVCEYIKGWDTGPGTRKCDKCKGKVITVIDQIAVDGDTIRVCDGKLD